jgi:hypothetical protein
MTYSVFRNFFIALATVTALAAGMGTAAALRSLSLEGTTTQTLNQRALSFGTELGSIIFDMTMVKTVSRVIPKISGTLVGRITDVRFSNFIGSGGVRRDGITSVTPVGLEAPERWRLFYVSILGTLPRITGLRVEIRDALLLILFRDIFTISHLCHILFNSTFLAAVGGDGTIGNLRSQTTQFLQVIDLNGNGCPATGEFVANGLVPLQTVRAKLL